MGKVGLTGANRRVRLAGTVVVAAAAIGGAVTAAPVAAATTKVTSVEIDSSLATVTSSTGHKLQVEVDAFTMSSAPGNATLDVTLTHDAGAKGEEDHTWTLPITNADLKASAATQGTLRVAAKQIAPYGSMDLTITPVAPTVFHSCNGASVSSSTKVKLGGTFFFASKSTGVNRWGTVGSTSSKKKFTFPGKSTLYLTYPGAAQCPGTGNDEPPCAAVTLWDTSSSTVDISGFDFLGQEVVFGTRFVILPNGPVGGFRASRVDEVVTSSPAPVLVSAPDAVNSLLTDVSLAIPTLGSLSTGSATITSTSGQAPQTEPCQTGETVEETDWTGAAYNNGASPLTLTAQVFGNLHVADNNGATIVQVTPSGAVPAHSD